MKRFVGLSLLAATLAFGDVPAADSAKQLYATGIRQTAEGKLEAARLTLRTLVNTFPKDPLALQAEGAIDATVLFEDGQARAKAGKYDTAKLAFETLIAVYPDNPLVPRAKTALDSIAEKDKANGKVVKAMEFRVMAVASPEEIRSAMEQREVRLGVGKLYRSRDVEQAKTALEAFLAEKGVTNAKVQAQTRSVPPHSVDVIFTIEKTRASLLTSPWRVAVAAWNRAGL